MKTVAFDCSGTLLHNKNARELFRWFQTKKCKLVIWSNSYQYCLDAQVMLKTGPSVELQIKSYRDEGMVVNIAVDDDGWLDKARGLPLLATNVLLDVSDIPDNSDLFEEKYGHLLK